MKKRTIVIIGALFCTLIIIFVLAIGDGDIITQEQLNTIDPWGYDIQCSSTGKFERCYHNTYDSICSGGLSCLTIGKVSDGLYRVENKTFEIQVEYSNIVSCLQLTNWTKTECTDYFVRQQVPDIKYGIRWQIEYFQQHPENPQGWDWEFLQGYDYLE